MLANLWLLRLLLEGQEHSVNHHRVDAEERQRWYRRSKMAENSEPDPGCSSCAFCLLCLAIQKLLVFN